MIEQLQAAKDLAFSEMIASGGGDTNLLRELDQLQDSIDQMRQRAASVDQTSEHRWHRAWRRADKDARP